MENLKQKIRDRYAYSDNSIFVHGKNYFSTASSIYENFKPENAYPLLTLLGFSAELFLKAFDIDLKEEFVEVEDGISSLISKKVRTVNNNGHDLEKLLDHYLVKDKELFTYLNNHYELTTHRDLKSDILNYSKVFEDSRYIFESNETGKYLSDIHIIYNLVKSFYDSILSIYQPVITERVSTSDASAI